MTRKTAKEIRVDHGEKMYQKENRGRLKGWVEVTKERKAQPVLGQRTERRNGLGNVNQKDMKQET